MARASHTHDPGPAPSRAPLAPHEALVLDRAAARAVDRAAIEEFKVPGIVLMENAARGLLLHALEMIGERRGESQRNLRAVLLCGSGNNGGDGYALARHLHNHRVDVLLVAVGAAPRDGGDAAINLEICRRMRLPEQSLAELVQNETEGDIDLVVDAILGTGLDRAVESDAATAIAWINSVERPILAVDVPSGMDCDTGAALGACVRATRTVTFLGLKPGFLGLEAQPLLGEVHVVDIGAPRQALERFARRVPLPRPLREPERAEIALLAAPHRD